MNLTFFLNSFHSFTFIPRLQSFIIHAKSNSALYIAKMDDSINHFHHFPNKALKLCSMLSDCKSLNPNPPSSFSSCVLTPTSGDEEVEFEPATSASYANDITLEEWQAWGTSSQIPAMVKKILDNVKPLERELEMQLDFCGTRGKLQGQGKVEEDKKHRGIYKDLLDPEQKLQFFTARQVAYRLLGSRGYLCQNCWLPLEDCMCSKLIQHSIWQGIRFWLYMHPKDFLRKNNTGKLLWQVYGKKAARLCIFGIQEHEEAMWNTFKIAGRDRVWCLYPEGKTDVCCFNELKVPECIASSNSNDIMDHAHAIWGDKGLSVIALSHSNVSVMHRLRPQPSLDRSCTAGAAIQLLYDLIVHQELESKKLAQSAEALEDSLDLLLNALSSRRQRYGKPVIRAQRWKNST
ncbi:uncharacterized protein LOC131063330 isoform X2 [Cryptomeria japonica]|uniref:uncharacterized protein LOC131063330 isoform X2 n=1 Tax=Cryptomeria japonica TaxID=3369 RepID=UPI0027D9D21C|nr:uncharacterized protein LOC131063330 isoform X2 [Cryptomeria japonica]